MYEARKISNLLLAKYSASEFDLTNLRLNKLLYFIHGWSLTSKPQGLVRNHFEAWDLGPVVRSVYDAFKACGKNRITSPAEYLDYASGKIVPIPYDDIPSDDVQIITRVFESYANFTTPELVRLSHHPGGPWQTVMQGVEKGSRVSPRIPNELIRQQFFLELGGKVRH